MTMRFEELWRQIGETRGGVELSQYLAAGGDINAAHPQSRWTLLHAATEQQDLALIQALADSGADIHAKDIHGWTPLHLAVDIDIDSVIQADGTADDIQFPTARLLLSLGANPTIADGNGETPRDVVAAYGADILARYDRLTSQ